MLKELLSKIAHEGKLFAQSRIFAPAEGAPDKVLVFVHLPKCAGNTLLPLFISKYRYGESVEKYSRTENVRLSEVLNGRAKCYCGHFLMDLETVPENFVVTSVMRDPVSRLASHYHFVRRWPAHTHHKPVIERNYSLKDYALSDLDNFELDNGQLRQLAYIPPEISINEQVYEAAHARIAQVYSLIGVMENLDAYVEALMDRMEWRRPARYRDRNVGGRETSGSVPPDAAAVIRERNKWDQRLYDEFAAGLVIPRKTHS